MQYGVRRDSSIKARAIVDPSNVAPIVAQLMLQRASLFRNTYTFRLGWKYCLLEPMDLVQITDARRGLSALTVRITSVEENEEGTLAITAEDFIGGYSSTVLYPKQSGAGYVPNWSSPPGDINPPIIFEPPALLQSGPEIWWRCPVEKIGAEPRSGFPPTAIPMCWPGASSHRLDKGP